MIYLLKQKQKNLFTIERIEEINILLKKFKCEFVLNLKIQNWLSSVEMQFFEMIWMAIIMHWLHQICDFDKVYWDDVVGNKWIAQREWCWNEDLHTYIKKRIQKKKSDDKIDWEGVVIMMKEWWYKG